MKNAQLDADKSNVMALQQVKPFKIWFIEVDNVSNLVAYTMGYIKSLFEVQSQETIRIKFRVRNRIILCIFLC